MTQYSIRPKRSAIRAQAVYFLHSTMRSVTCVRLSDVSVIWRVTYFQFPIQYAFLIHIGRQATPALHCTYIRFDTQYRTSYVAENFSRYLSCAERTERGQTELILTVKIETRHHVEVSLVVNFRPSVIIAQPWRPLVATRGIFVSNFCVFLKKKRHLMVKFSKFCLVVNFRPSIIIAQPRRPLVARRGNFVSNFCVFFKRKNATLW